MNSATSTATARTVLELNSFGVSLLSQGKYCNAQENFQMALQAYRNGFLIMKPQFERVSWSSNLHQEEDTPLETVAICNPQTDSLEEESMSIIPVYNHAFVLTSHSCLTDNEHTFPAILLYNMGLSYHLQAAAKKCGNYSLQSTSISLHNKALQFYTMSFEVLTGATTELSEVDMLVLLALSNNMCSLLPAVQLQDHVQQGGNEIILVMEHILTDTECLDVLDEDDIEFFSLNLMFLTQHQDHPMPAAAA